MLNLQCRLYAIRSIIYAMRNNRNIGFGKTVHEPLFVGRAGGQNREACHHGVNQYFYNTAKRTKPLDIAVFKLSGRYFVLFLKSG